MLKIIGFIIVMYLMFALGSVYGLGVGVTAESASKRVTGMTFEELVDHYRDDFPWICRMVFDVVKYGILCGKKAFDEYE